ncbi:hypothetical protein BKA70DRAFT_1401099 [Coprinopsis sp. MPI-PUGE-AT-0042]|nr:hypothetical protein BKA70DRAFT_1401099 [Coprinopsis sp. MPI-PUGE-AT-0042]
MPSTSPSTHTTSGSTMLDFNFEIEQETGFRDKPHIRQTKKRKGIAYTMRVFPTIPKKADSPLDRGIYTLVAQGHMCTDRGHGGGDKEDEDDNRGKGLTGLHQNHLMGRQIREEQLLGHWECDEAEQVAFHSQAVSPPILSTSFSVDLSGDECVRLWGSFKTPTHQIDHDLHWTVINLVPMIGLALAKTIWGQTEANALVSNKDLGLAATTSDPASPLPAEPGHLHKNDRSTPIPSIVVTGFSPSKQDLNDPEYGLMVPSPA